MATLDDLAKKPLERGEIIVDNVLSIDAAVDIEANPGLSMGAIVFSIDAGATWKKLGSKLPVTPYRLGVLGDYINKNTAANIILIGRVKETESLATEVKVALFKDNIILL